MYTMYRTTATELDSNFLHSLKLLFGDKPIEITVGEVSDRDSEEETDFLLQLSANRERLLQAIDNVAKGQNLVTVELS